MLTNCWLGFLCAYFIDQLHFKSIFKNIQLILNKREKTTTIFQFKCTSGPPDLIMSFKYAHNIVVMCRVRWPSKNINTQIELYCYIQRV